MSSNTRVFKQPGESDEQALERLRKQVGLDHRSIQFVPLAELLRKHGHYEEAINVCVTGLQYHPGYPTGMLALARARRDQGDLERASISYAKAVLLAPDNAVARWEAADVFEKLGQPKEAAAHIRAARALGFEDPALDTRLTRLEAALTSSSVALMFEASSDDESLPDYEALNRASLLRRRIERLKGWRNRMMTLQAPARRA